MNSLCRAWHPPSASYFEEKKAKSATFKTVLGDSDQVNSGGWEGMDKVRMKPIHGPGRFAPQPSSLTVCREKLRGGWEEGGGKVRMRPIQFKSFRAMLGYLFCHGKARMRLRVGHASPSRRGLTLLETRGRDSDAIESRKQLNQLHFYAILTRDFMQIIAYPLLPHALQLIHLCPKMKSGDLTRLQAPPTGAGRDR